MSDKLEHDDIKEPEPVSKSSLVDRRNLLIGGGILAAGTAVAGGAYALRPAPLQRTAAGLRKVRLAWNANALCESPILLAQKYGLFAKNGIEVELVNFAGSTDQLLEIIATGKADAGLGMILRWIKPLQQGFDVKLLAGTDGGCFRVVGSRKQGIIEGDIQSLRGKTIGMSEIQGTGRFVAAILLKANGIDPNTEVHFRAFPSPLLKEAVDKGEIHAFVDGDPLLYILQKESNGDLVDVMSNLSPPWQRRFCCVLGASGTLVRNDPEAARGLAFALVAASSICAKNPEEAARVFAPYAKASVEDLVAVLNKSTHAIHPIGADLIHQIGLYVAELRDIGVFDKSLDPQRFAESLVVNVFA